MLVKEKVFETYQRSYENKNCTKLLTGAIKPQVVWSITRIEDAEFLSWRCLIIERYLGINSFDNFKIKFDNFRLQFFV